LVCSTTMGTSCMRESVTVRFLTFVVIAARAA
jgi:hypothetical protein